ncbi:MAG TPA: hypothetical protein VFI72_10075 [Candidatus Angelobacter sp.]|nr:hypothetical protein [Candidatus Angelobacter sp.]
MFLLAAYLVIAAVFSAAWYWVSVRRSRRRAKELARWIESALYGQGQVAGIRWLTPSRFKVPLRLTCGLFHRACVTVEMTPCEMPFRWLISKVRGHQEVITFQADLDPAPGFSLNVQNFRWFARSSRRTPRNRNGWTFEQTGPIVLSTRQDWQKEITSAMTSLAHGNHEFSSVMFQRRTPHFSVTLPLEAIAPGAPERACLFESMRELASSASASLF